MTRNNGGDELELMGQRVIVTATLERVYEGARRTWEEQPCGPWTGWIVGFRHVQNGIHHPASGGASDTIFGFAEEWDPPYLEQTGTVKCALVAPGPRRNPVKVPMDGWKIKR